MLTRAHLGELRARLQLLQVELEEVEVPLRGGKGLRKGLEDIAWQLAETSRLVDQVLTEHENYDPADSDQPSDPSQT